MSESRAIRCILLLGLIGCGAYGIRVLPGLTRYAAARLPPESVDRFRRQLPGWAPRFEMPPASERPAPAGTPAADPFEDPALPNYPKRLRSYDRDERRPPPPERLQPPGWFTPSPADPLRRQFRRAVA
jgi:hypothetical protein